MGTSRPSACLDTGLTSWNLRHGLVRLGFWRGVLVQADCNKGKLSTSIIVQDPIREVFQVDLLAQSSYEYPIIIICPDNWLDLDKALSLGFTLDALTYSFGYLYSNENVFTLENVTTAKEAFFRAYEQNGFSSLDDYYEAITMNVSLTKSIDEFLKDQTAALLCVTCVHEPRKMILDGAVCYYFSLANQDGTRRSLGRHPIAMKLSDKTGGFLQVTPIWKLHAVNNNDLLLKVSAAACVPLETSCWTVVRISVQRFVKGKEGDAACVTKEEKAVRYANSSPDACYMKCISEASGQSGGKCRMHHDTVGKAKSPAKYCNYFESSLSKHVARLSHMHLESNRRNALISPECTRKCPYECDRVIYEASLKDRVKEEYLSAAMQQIGRIIRAQNMSVIGLRLEHEAAYNGGILTVEEMSTLSFTSMVANIGGALGLFVGGTMMTFVQMTLFVVKKLLDRRVRNSQAHPMDSTYSA